MLGDISPGLIRVGAIEPELNDQLWLLTHPDIRNSDRIQGFMTHCIETIRKNRGLIEGLSGSKSNTAKFADLALRSAAPSAPDNWALAVVDLAGGSDDRVGVDAQT